jgi:PAS domain S-box-containing protein
MEMGAFEKIRSEAPRLALAPLQSPEYFQWKSEYRDGVQTLLDHVHARIDAHDHNARGLSRLTELTAICALLALLGFFGFLLFLFRRESAFRAGVEARLAEEVRQATAHMESARTKLEVEISRQKEVERRLLASERRFRNVTLTSGDWIWEVDVQGVYTYVSESVTGILGYPPEELVGRTPFDLMPPEEAERIRQLFHRMAAGKAAVVDVENLNLHKDGSPAWLLTNGIPQLDDNGRLTGYFGVDKDITARKETEDALALRVRQLTALNVLSREIAAELSPESVFRKIVEGIGEWVRPEQLLLFLPDADGRMRLSHWHPPEMNLRPGAPLSPPLETCLCHRAMAENIIVASTNVDTPCCRLSGEIGGENPPAAAAIPLRIGERVVGMLQLMGKAPEGFSESPEFLDSVAGIIASGLDNALLHQRVREQAGRLEVTVAERTRELSDTNARLRRENEERRKAERAMRAAKEEADRASRAKSDFLARMSHEIRTPMNAILNMTELARLTHLNEEQREYLRSVSDSGRHLLNLINDILDIARIESGRLELETRDFDLVDMLRTLLGSMREQARKKGLYLELDIDDTFAPHLRGDPFRLQQVLINLIGNGIKFTESGGVTLAVTCRTPGSCLRPEAADGNEGAPEIELLFRVADTGIGIPPEVGDAIFDAFRQSDSSISRRFGGTGLGLTICRQIVEMMDGRLWFERPPAGGTRFSFTARLQLGNPARVDEDSARWVPPPSRRRPLSILLAEDNPENVRVARGLIARLGHRLKVAGDGAAVLDRLRAEAFDLVLMDVEMPGMDGLEATRRIRGGGAGEDRRDIRIVALTAHALSGFREKCLAAGMDHYLAKPFSLAQLFALLGRAEGSEISPPEPPPAPEERSGMDISGALGRLFGDGALYSRLCRAFLESLPEKRRQLRRMHRREKWAEMALLVHTLKGNCANIGAEDCRKAAESLERILRKPPVQKYPGRLDDLDAALNAAQAEISRWLAASEPHGTAETRPEEAAPENAPAEMIPALDRLAEALARGEVDDEAVRILFAQSPANLNSEAMSALGRALDAFEFETAEAIVNRLRLSLSSPGWED